MERSFYLIVGALGGALISIHLTIKAQRPRLIISGSGSGGSQQKQRWSVSVSNRPSFLGLVLDGESARDVHAHLQLKEKGAASYLIYWSGQNGGPRVTIDPGQYQSLDLFFWFPGAKGYCVVDAAGDPVARFESRELRFVLRLSDRLGRETELPFTVAFDDSHLKNTPRLQITPRCHLRAGSVS